MPEPTAKEQARAYNARGVEQQQRGSVDEALASYRYALRFQPDLAEAHNNVGTLLGALGRTGEAIPHLYRAIELRPELAAIRANLAVALYLEERLEEAAAQYRHAIALEPENAVAIGHLGEILVGLGRLDEARELLERSIRLSPRTGWFYRRWAESKTVHSSDDIFAAMESLAAQAETIAPEDRMHLHYALGKARHDVGRYEEALAALCAANAIRRGSIDYDEGKTLERLDRIRTTFSKELMAVRAGLGDPSMLPVFIVGMPRSGTTLVEQIVASHPRVFGGGELGAFERFAAASFPGFPESVETSSNERFGELGSAYTQFLAGKAGAAIRATDKTLENVAFLGLIALALPQARIVHVTRDPVDTCMSAYAQYFRSGQPYSYDLAELGRYYRSYRALMHHWEAVLPHGMMLEVRYETLVASFEPQARRIVAHCGLVWNASCLDFHKAGRPVTTASAAQVRRPLYAASIDRWRPYRPWIGELLDQL